ncbi:unnamed protein product [Cunninghamella echinulata]
MGSIIFIQIFIHFPPSFIYHHAIEPRAPETTTTTTTTTTTIISNENNNSTKTSILHTATSSAKATSTDKPISN